MEIRLGETNRLSKLMTHLSRRWRRPRTDRLPDYLLRDAGLERVGGVTRRRPR
jgi:hypothetical protein